MRESIFHQIIEYLCEFHLLLKMEAHLKLQLRPFQVLCTVNA